MLSPNVLKKELFELAKIQLYINSHGGAEKNENLCDEHLARGLKMLQNFGLPTSKAYVDILFVDKLPTDADLDVMIKRLVQAAKDYLSSPVKTEIQILEGAVKIKADQQQILPELGITLHIYTQFVYEHILLEKRDTPANVLEALRLANTPRTLNLLGIVALAKALGEEEKKMMEELFGMGIKYLDLYLTAYRVEDEKDKHHFSQLDEFWNDLTGGYEFKTLEDKFETLTHYLMNYLFLQIGYMEYRIVELEVYYHDPDKHPDPYVRFDFERLYAGQWHYNGTGFEITMGDYEKGIYGGILIRGIRTIEEQPRYISGTKEVLRELFSGIGNITDDEFGISIKELEDGVVSEEEPIRSTRIGLRKRKTDTENYAAKQYRYIVELNEDHNFKDKERVVNELFADRKITNDQANEILGYGLKM